MSRSDAKSLRAIASRSGGFLKDVFQNEFAIGAALNADQICSRDPAAMDLVTRHFSSITPENILKWEAVHPKPEQYNFEVPDRYVDFGEKHGMQVIGHTLVWHAQTPDWVFVDASGHPLSREALLERMKAHIFTVMGRYKGRIHGWDVVNEAVKSDGSLRRSKWLEIIGEDYLAKAFEFARQADPNAELYYNEYDLYKQPKCEGTVRLVRNLQAKGVRVDGVGIQGHWSLDHPSIREIESSVRMLAELNVPLMVTELDISVLPFHPIDAEILDISSFDAEKQKKMNPYPDELPDAVQEKLADRYADLFALFLKHRDTFGRITFWGVHDGQTWRNYWPVTGRTDHPMLFDRNGRPKPAFQAVVETAEGRTGKKK